MSSEKLGIGVIGAGRVGLSLANAFRAAGHGVVGIHARSQAGKQRCGEICPGIPTLEISQIIERSQLVLLAVPDDVLPALVVDIAQAPGWVSGQLVAHTAGRYGVDVLAPATAQGAIPLALHPAMTFTGTSIDLARLTGISWAVTAGTGMGPVAHALVLELEGYPLDVAEANRAGYHAGLVHGANHVVGVIEQAATLLRRAGIDEPARVLEPLVRASIDGVMRSGAEALTGPAARGDIGTLAAHLDAVEAADDPILEASYRVLATACAQLAKRLGRIDDAQVAAISALLGLAEVPGDLGK